MARPHWKRVSDTEPAVNSRIARWEGSGENPARIDSVKGAETIPAFNEVLLPSPEAIASPGALLGTSGIPRES